MAFENLFIRTKRGIGSVALDGVISEGHSASARVTSNPVEKGFDVADHVIIEPKIVTIIGSITDTPLGVAAFQSLASGVTSFFEGADNDSPTRSQQGYLDLLALMEKKEEITLQTKLFTYENSMIITNIDVVQDKDSSRVVELIVILKEVIISQTEVLALEDDPGEAAVADKTSKEKDEGKKTVETPDPENKTLLKVIVDFGVGLFK